MLADSKRDFVVFLIVMSIVLTHNALQFGELSDHQSTQIGFCQLSCAAGQCGIGTDLLSNAGGDLLNALASFKLSTELVVVDHMGQAGAAGFKRLETILIIEEFRIGQTSSNNAGVAGTNRFAAVFGFDLRNQQEAVHQFLILILQRKVFLILLHRQNQALDGDR